ncbi:hypothetical protein L195_g019552 [Trifolium pratense]|uniref:Uncharacterized protein n=1 Tax=Trifolium pratense TaxID=57577 RepID=A0A2K3MZY9_TRIPR|nr:hypothetical protein L195_g019552 [Trifolium pratense]
MMMMTTMNVYATSYHLDIHAGSSSHSQEPPSQTVNVDEFGGSYNNNRKKKNKKNIDDGRTTAYHAKNIPICNMHVLNWTCVRSMFLALYAVDSSIINIFLVVLPILVVAAPKHINVNLLTLGGSCERDDETAWRSR